MFINIQNVYQDGAVWKEVLTTDNLLRYISLA